VNQFYNKIGPIFTKKLKNRSISKLDGKNGLVLQTRPAVATAHRPAVIRTLSPPTAAAQSRERRTGGDGVREHPHRLPRRWPPPQRGDAPFLLFPYPRHHTVHAHHFNLTRWWPFAQMRQLKGEVGVVARADG
jgi:hypothetical protein